MALTDRETLQSGATAVTTFSDTVEFANWDGGSFQVVWNSNYNAGSAGTDVFTLYGSNDNSNFEALENGSVSLTTGGGNKVFNLTYVGYDYIKGEYVPDSATTGQLSVYVVRKSRQ